MDLPSHLPKPKLCHLKKRTDFVGYGFNLHSEKGKPGQFIGKVDPNSPSEISGLEPNDVVIEINGEYVVGFTHQQVVSLVKANAGHVDMYVCAQDTFNYCQENGIRIASTQPPRKLSATDTATAKQPELRQQQPKPQQQKKQQPQQQQPQQQQPQQQQQQKKKQQQPKSQNSQQPRAGSSGGSDDPVAGISLEEMRAKLGSNRRTQAMFNSATFTEKYSMFESL